MCMFHGDCDTVVPIQESVNILTKIHERGSNAKLKICYGYNTRDIAYDGLGIEIEGVVWVYLQNLHTDTIL